VIPPGNKVACFLEVMDFNFNLSKEQQLILLGLIISLVIGFGVKVYQHFSRPSQGIIIEEPGARNVPAVEGTIMVHVCGAVHREGVFKLKLGDRLLDALKLAGGPLPSADLSGVNLAERVKDGEKIIVPEKQKVVEEGIGNASSDRSSERKEKDKKKQMSFSKININTADEKMLDSLPGIGPATAKAIIEYRRKNGPFARIEQIMEIPRFGKSKFEKIKDRVTL